MVGYVPKVRPDAAVGIMGAKYAGEIHKGDGSNSRIADVKLER